MIGEKVRVLRVGKNISQEELADYLNVSRQTISKWENNRSLPDIENLVLIANYFEVALTELIDLEVELKPVQKQNKLVSFKKYVKKIGIGLVGFVLILLIGKGISIYQQYYSDPTKEIEVIGCRGFIASNGELAIADISGKETKIASYHDLVWYVLTHETNETLNKDRTESAVYLNSSISKVELDKLLAKAK